MQVVGVSPGVSLLIQGHCAATQVLLFCFSLQSSLRKRIRWQVQLAVLSLHHYHSSAAYFGPINSAQMGHKYTATAEFYS